MIAVLDVSAAIEILLQKKKKEIFNDLYKKASWVIAPDMIDDYFRGICLAPSYFPKIRCIIGCTNKNLTR